MLEELRAADEFAAQFEWSPEIDAVAPRFRVRMKALDGEVFVLDVACDDYREKPAFFEFLDPDTGALGTQHSYPVLKGDSFFHGSPCICAPFNRKAYRAEHPAGPHSDWPMGEWSRSRAQGVDWSNASTLAGMLFVIQTRLLLPEFYGGRRP